MAETATEGQYTDAPPRPFSSLDRVAAETAAPPSGGTDGALAKIAEARAAERQGLEDKAQGMKPAYQAVMDMGEKRDATATTLMPQKPTLQEPPSRGLRDFLAPSENDTPMNSIMKLVQAMSLFIGGASGAVRGDGIGALAAFTGALTGWQQGDAERADRAYKDWQAKTDKALHQYSLDRKEYEDIMLAADKSLEQKIAEAKIKAMELGDEQAIKAFDSANAVEWYSLADDRDKHRDLLKLRKDQIDAGVLKAREAHEQKLELQANQQMFMLRLEGQRRAEKADEARQRRQELMEAYQDPAVLRPIAIDYAKTGRLPPNIARGRDGQTLIPIIVADATKWAHEQGVDPNNFASLRADIRTSTQALGAAEKGKTTAQVAVGTFERHMDQLVELSKKVPRSEMPAINGAIVRGQQNYAGSVEAAKYVALAFEAAQEFAKISVGTAQGDANSREEARKSIAIALNHEQLVGLRDELKKAAHSRMQEWDSRIRDLRMTAGGGAAKGGGGKSRTVTVNGKSVTVTEE